MRLSQALAGALLVFSCLGGGALAQPQTYRGPDVAAQRAAMDRLEPLAGVWQGEARVQYPHAMVVHQTERVERELGGLLLSIRGMGHADAARSGDPIFQAAGIISFNERRGLYEMRTYTHEGYSTTADGEFLPDGSFRWGFVAGGPVHMRFTISFDAESWREVGEISHDSGATWRETINLNLRRVA